MDRIVFLLASIITLSSACSRNGAHEKNVAYSFDQDSVNMELKLTRLIQTVLNSPGVIKFSKAEFIRKKYGKIYISFDEKVPKPNSSIYQMGSALEVANLKLTSDTPCYVFKKIEFHENTAYVMLNFDVTGFFSSGNLNYIDGKWVLDKDFVIGYR